MTDPRRSPAGTTPDDDGGAPPDPPTSNVGVAPTMGGKGEGDGDGDGSNGAESNRDGSDGGVKSRGNESNGASSSASASASVASSSSAEGGRDGAPSAMREERASSSSSSSSSSSPASSSAIQRDLPLIFLAGFFSIVFSVLGTVYRRYGMTAFVDRSHFDLKRNASEWRAFLDGDDDDDDDDGGGVGGGGGGGGKTVLLIGGPHRAGTTLLWRAISSHPEVSGLGSTFDTGSDHSEGILMQDVYPRYGVGLELVRKNDPSWRGEMRGVGRYALGDEGEVHLNETDGRVSPANMARIMNRFGYHWDLSKPVLAEKSPPTAVMSRFLQALYNVDAEDGGAEVEGGPSPESETEEEQEGGEGEGRSGRSGRSVTKFLFITRHPIANAYAHHKLLGGPDAVPLDTLLDNYVRIHRYLKSDMARLLNDPRLIRLEDFVSDPAAELGAIFDWLGVDSSMETVRGALEGGVGEEISSDPNAKYQEVWCRSRAPGQEDWMRYITAERYQKDVDELGLGYDIKGWCRKRGGY